MTPRPLPDPPLSWLHLGDSYTIGEGVPSRHAWPSLFHQRLHERGFPVAKSDVLARTGWTVSELLGNFRSASIHQPWDRITLCIGVNNQYRGGDPATFSLELEQLVQEARPLLDPLRGELILFSIPDWSVSPYGKEKAWPGAGGRIDAFNAAARVVSGRVGVPFLDWTPLTRECAGQHGAFAGDGLHPSAMQHARWAAFLEESLL